MIEKSVAALLAVLALGAPALAAAPPAQVYTIDNAATGNHLYVYDVADDGALSLNTSLDTGGRGTGASLGNQGALALTGDGHRLLAVNAGSNSIAAFDVTGARPVLLGVSDAGGRRPISIAVAGRLVAVLDAGGAAGGVDQVALFLLGPHGRLAPLRGATRPLSAASTGPAQVSFARDGNVLVVTEKATSRIDTFVIGDDGTLSPAKSFPSASPVPYGFSVAGGNQLVVSEAGANALSSYQVGDDGDLETITAALPTQQRAPCWVAVSYDNRYGYTADAGSSTLTGVSIAADGSLALLQPNGASAPTGSQSAPLDLAFSRDRRFLFVLNHGSNTIGAFRASSDGALAAAGDVGGVPATSTGLIAR